MSRRILKPDGSYYRDFDDSEGFSNVSSSEKVDLSQKVVCSEKGGATMQTHSSPSSITVTRSRVGEQVPMWQKLVANNNDATGYFQGNTTWMRPGFVGCTVTWKAWGQTYESVYTGPANHNMVGSSTSTREAADQKARIKFYAKLRRELQDMSGGPFLGELGKTLREIRRPAKALSDLADNFTRKEALRQIASRQGRAGYGPAYWNNPSKPKRPSGLSSREWERMVKDGIRTAGDMWLSFSFGALPLVNDIDGGAKAIASLVGRDTHRRVIAFGEEYLSESIAVLRALGVTSGYIRPLYYDLVVADNEQTVVVYRAGLKNHLSLDTPLDTMIHLGGRFGLSAGELVSTAYELTPWSFLVDYFSSLGSLVNAAALSTNDIAWTNKTARTIRERSTSGRINVGATTQAYAASGWQVQSVIGDVSPSSAFSKDVLRSKISSVPLPRLEIGFKSSPMKLANIAALLTGLLRRP